jgi:hypothetical protein
LASILSGTEVEMEGKTMRNLISIQLHCREGELMLVDLLKCLSRADEDDAMPTVLSDN